MSRRTAGPRRRPYWLLAAFLAYLLSPPSWAPAALLAAAVVIAALRIYATIARRSAAVDGGQAAVLLGHDSESRKVLLSDEQLSAHGLILGASGSGKSTTLLRILGDHLRQGRPVVAIDMKGSPGFARQLAETAAGAGRPLRLWTPDGPTHWNPLAHGNPTELKDKLIATERFTEPHYRRAAERYVQTVLQVLEQAHPERRPTLQDVVALMDPARMLGMLRLLQSPLANRLQDYLAGLTPDQLSAVRGLGTRLAVITESHTGAFLLPPPDAQRPVLDLHQALSGREVVLFSLNSSRYVGFGAQLGTLVVQDLVAAVGHRLGDFGAGDAVGGRDRVIIAIDEFSALGADHVIALLARARESGVCVVLATQELADLDRAAPGMRDQVLGNTALKIAHRQDVPASARTVAQMVGTETVWEETHHFGGLLRTPYETGRGTRRAVERFIIDPNEIRTLATGEAVVITKLPRAGARIVRVAPDPHQDPGAPHPAPAAATPDVGRYPAPGVTR